MASLTLTLTLTPARGQARARGIALIAPLCLAVLFFHGHALAFVQRDVAHRRMPRPSSMHVQMHMPLQNAGAKQVIVGAIVGASLLLNGAFVANAVGKYNLPSIDFTDPDRCTLKSSAMGQANAQRDKLYDLRQCKLNDANAAGFDLSGALMGGADFSSANFKEAQLSKAWAKGANFENADFTGAVVDRAEFAKTNLKGAVLANAVLTGSSFEGANLEDTDFTDSYLGPFDLKNLCLNPSLKGTNPKTGVDTRASLGCE